MSLPNIPNCDILTFDLEYNDYVSIISSIDNEILKYNFLVDTQADISVLKISSLPETFYLNTSKIINIKGITHDSLQSLGTIFVNLNFNNDVIEHEFHVVPDAFNIDCDGIIGKNFLIEHKCKIDYSKMTFSIPSESNSATILKISNSPDGISITIPPRSEVIRLFDIDYNNDCVVDQIELAPGVYTARSIVNPKTAFIRVINTTNYPQKVYKKITQIEPLENFCIYEAKQINVDNDRIEKLKNIILRNVPDLYHKKMSEIIESFSDVFSLPEDKMTINNFYEQTLRTTDNSPTYIKNYRTPHTSKTEIQKQINKLLDSKLIEPCASNFNSPVILVPKKSQDGTKKWRMCMDYRSVNKKLVADKYPLPRIDDILDNLGRAVLFSVIDLYCGFHQVPLEEKSRDITAFSTEQGSFRWKVLPFGLNVSPNSFSRMMNLAFSGLPSEKLFIYIDDIIVLGKSEQDHLNNLKEMFSRCRERNLKINPEKCNFFKTEVLFLGHLCNQDGIKPDPSKFKTISEYPIPKDSDAVRRFVALANYYRKFIPNFSLTSIPLNKLTKKNAKFEWEKEQNIAFNKIKENLSNPKILAYPDYSQQFVLTVDASKNGVGAVLSQNNSPIAFASKAFTRAERNKATIEQELIAIHWAIKHFRHYLYGTHFIVQSDHKPLKYLYNLKESSAKLTRLRLELAEYVFTIEHIKGKNNVVADALSRIHIDDIRPADVRDSDLKICVITRSMRQKEKEKAQNEIIKDNSQRNKENENEIKEPNIMHALSREELKGIPTVHTQLISRASDPKIFNISVHYKYRSNDELYSFSIPFVQETLFLKQLFSQLQKIADELDIRIMKIFENESLFEAISINRFKDLGNRENEILKNLKIRVAEPIAQINDEKEKKELIRKFHEDPLYGGHCGITKTLSKLKRKFTWKNMSTHVKKYVESCTQCQLNKPKIKIIEPLTVTDTPQKTFEKISIDTIGPLPMSENGNKYALTMMCDLSKYMIPVAIPNKEAKTVAKSIFINLILVYGPIKIIMSDQGKEFVNSVLNELCLLLNIEHVKSTPYHHETLGSVERNHRVFNEYLRTYLDNDSDWEEYLQYFAFCYNISYHSSFDNKYTPFELIFAKNINMPECLGNDKIDPVYDIDNFVKEAKYRLQITAKNAKELLERNKKRSKEIYDRRINPINIKLHDTVMVRDETRHKHDPIFKGPYLVVEISDPNVTILDQKTNKTKIVHKNNINKYQT